jgi:methyl-accepting chemotaxis protein
VRVESSRDVYNQGKAALGWLLMLTGAALVIFGIAAVVLMEKYFITRLSHLTSRLLQIGEAHDLSARIEDMTEDEVGQLAGAINSMLTDLSSAQKKEVEFSQSEKLSAEQLQQRVREIERMNEMMGGREQKMNEMKETIRQLEARLAQKK